MDGLGWAGLLDDDRRVAVTAERAERCLCLLCRRQKRWDDHRTKPNQTNPSSIPFLEW